VSLILAQRGGSGPWRAPTYRARVGVRLIPPRGPLPLTHAKVGATPGTDQPGHVPPELPLLAGRKRDGSGYCHGDPSKRERVRRGDRDIERLVTREEKRRGSQGTPPLTPLNYLTLGGSQRRYSARL
jgi:hypothetical protein